MWGQTQQRSGQADPFSLKWNGSGIPSQPFPLVIEVLWMVISHTWTEQGLFSALLNSNIKSYSLYCVYLL